ncbi:MAG TPA: NAD(P)-dependent oxidoreductase [Candidatus Hydrogenedentes bacterium]|nr:NAD(P)-dependent oxidoreductase [Candidatus Hydrogenedentota bacterium]
MQVGIIGLGLIGKAIAKRLLGAGHAVRGYDIAPAACEAAQSLGVEVLTDAPAVAEATSAIFLCLMTSNDRRALLWGGQNLASVLQPGTSLIDTATARPEDIVEDNERLAMQQVRLIDVCISGSSEVVSKGQAIALVGGRKEEASYLPLLKTFTKAQYFFDEPGQGNRMKLIVNMVFGLNRLVLAEALGLAKKAGFVLPTVLEVLKAGETYSVAMDTKGPKMIYGQYENPVARLAQHAKDVDLILEYARSLQARTPISETHAELLKEVISLDAGELDNAAIFKAYE